MSDIGQGRPAEEVRHHFETANGRFQSRYAGATAVGILVATAIHFGLFALNPRLQISRIEADPVETVSLTLPPEVRIPPPPQQIMRPARPRVAGADLAPEVTIAPTTFGANPVETLPVPPRVATPEKEEMPFLRPAGRRAASAERCRDRAPAGAEVPAIAV
jgi:hypothetical protein